MPERGMNWSVLLGSSTGALEKHYVLYQLHWSPNCGPAQAEREASKCEHLEMKTRSNTHYYEPSSTQQPPLKSSIAGQFSVKGILHFISSNDTFVFFQSFECW